MVSATTDQNVPDVVFGEGKDEDKMDSDSEEEFSGSSKKMKRKFLVDSSEDDEGDGNNKHSPDTDGAEIPGAPSPSSGVGSKARIRRRPVSGEESSESSSEGEGAEVASERKSSCFEPRESSSSDGSTSSAANSKCIRRKKKLHAKVVEESKGDSSDGESEELGSVHHADIKAASTRCEKERKQSKKSREHNLKEIYSESSRMLRESSIGLPYHAPKQRTLDEFLKRRKQNIFPSLVNDIKLTNFNRKDEYALQSAEKMLREREAQAEEFFANDEVVVDGEEQPLQDAPGSQQVERLHDTEMGTAEAAKDSIAVGEIMDDAATKPRTTEEEEELPIQDTENLILFLEPDTESLVLDDDDDVEKVEIGDILNKTPIIGKRDPKDDFVVFDPVGEDVVKAKNGLEDLQARFVKHVRGHKVAKRSNQPVVVMTIVSKETDCRGNARLQTEKLSYDCAPDHLLKNAIDFETVRAAKKSERIGAQHLALKATLKEKIAEKKRMEREKKIKEQLENESDDDDEPCGDDDGEEEEVLNDGDMTEDEESDDDPHKAATKRIKNARSFLLDDEAEEEEEEGGDALTKADRRAIDDAVQSVLDDDEDSLPDTCQLMPEATSKQFSTPNLVETSSQIGSFLPTSWTPFDQRTAASNSTADEGDSIAARKKLGFEGLLDDTDPQVADMDDVVGLLSGQFATQKRPAGKEDQAVEESQEVEEDRLLPGFMEEDCGFLMLQSSSEDESNAELKEKKKKKRGLILSDESSGDEQENKDSSEDDDDAEEKVVMYDSEENEVVLTVSEREKRFKGFKDRKGRLRRDFVDNEAALSGSDDEVSEDEDERGLDRLDVEEGDLDEVDEDHVRDELGRFHHRELLNRDQQEIRYLQEVMLEDGDLHSENTRTRKFRWNDLDEAIELEKRPSDDEEDEADAKQAEEEKRLMERLEREKWLKDSNEMNETEEDGKFFNVASRTLKKLTSEPLASSEPKTMKLFQSSQVGAKRGSFLSRETSTLEKLAELTSKTGDRSGSGVRKVPANFIFASLSPEKKTEEKAAAEPVQKRKTPLASSRSHKKLRMDRSINESSRNTIFKKLI